MNADSHHPNRANHPNHPNRANHLNHPNHPNPITPITLVVLRTPLVYVFYQRVWDKVAKFASRVVFCTNRRVGAPVYPVLVLSLVLACFSLDRKALSSWQTKKSDCLVPKHFSRREVKKTRQRRNVGCTYEDMYVDSYTESVRQRRGGNPAPPCMRKPTVLRERFETGRASILDKTAAAFIIVIEN